MRFHSALALATALAAITLAGCSADHITNDRSKAFASRASVAPHSEARPWKGDCDVAAQFISATELIITGTCELAHLGRTAVLIHQTVTQVGNDYTLTNAAIYTAANGDELHTTATGTATATSTGLALLGTETAVSGTGAFANVSGTAALTGTVRFTGPGTAAGLYHVDGTMQYGR